MNIFETVLLGFIQGVTEVLPISSSGHLVLTPWFFGFEDPGLSFNVALHIGTLVAIIGYFRRDLWLMTKNGWKGLKTGKMDYRDNRLLYLILIATVPGVIAGLLLESQAESIFRQPLLVASTVFTFGIVLLLAERFAKNKKIENLTANNALLTGLAQAISIIPGVSRSGITISAGMFQGFSRESAAKFSFLMSIPIIAGAGLYKMTDIPANAYLELSFWVGMGTAVIASFLSVKFLMSFVKNHSLRLFAYYRFVLAIIILVFYFYRS